MLINYPTQTVLCMQNVDRVDGLALFTRKRNTAKYTKMGFLGSQNVISSFRRLILGSDEKQYMVLFIFLLLHKC